MMVGFPGGCASRFMFTKLCAGPMLRKLGRIRLHIYFLYRFNTKPILTVFLIGRVQIKYGQVSIKYSFSFLQRLIIYLKKLERDLKDHTTSQVVISLRL